MSKLNTLLKEAIEIIRNQSFVDAYKLKATDEECLGLAISHYFEWDSRIFKVFYEALEDANFHSEAAEIEEKYSKYFPNQNGKEVIKNGTSLWPKNLATPC